MIFCAFCLRSVFQTIKFDLTITNVGDSAYIYILKKLFVSRSDVNSFTVQGNFFCLINIRLV